MTTWKRKRKGKKTNKQSHISHMPGQSNKGPSTEGTMAPIVSIGVLFLLPLESMAAHRTVYGRVVKFGTLIEDSPNITHSKFGVSNSNSLAPPLVQSFTLVYANNCEP